MHQYLVPFIPGLILLAGVCAAGSLDVLQQLHMAAGCTCQPGQLDVPLVTPQTV